MYIRQAVAVCGALFVISIASQPIWAQEEELQEGQPQFSENELNDVRVLRDVINETSMGITAAPTQFPLTWVHQSFLAEPGGNTAIFFTLAIDRSQLSTSNVGMYVRADDKSVFEMDKADPEVDPEADPEAGMVDPYAWSDVRFFEVPDDGYVMGSMAVPPGEHEVFIAIKEISTGDEEADALTKVSLLRHDLNAPDFSEADQLAVSSFMVGEMEMKAPDDTKIWNRYVIGGALHIRPKLELSFTKAEGLTLFFFIYGGQIAAQQQPDLQLSWQFYRVSPEGEETAFAAPLTQSYNAENLPGEYSGQVPAQFGVPLEQFPASDFRLEATVTDQSNDKMVTQDIKFSVLE
tara:strand:- start:36 stop:1082 length:1047 start_codon:yes stop_codon:yes gene_type:complete